MRLSLHCLWILAVLITFSSCQDFFKKTEPPPPPEPLPPQTKEEVLAEITYIIGPLRATIVPGAPIISDMERDQVMRGLKDAIVKHGNTEFGKAALRELGYEIADIARKAAADSRYRLVQICIDAYELLSMESQLLKRLGSRAEVMLGKPIVRAQGFLEDVEKKQLYVFLEVKDRKTGEIERVQVREGDEFHNLRLVKITGRNQTVILEYLPLPGLYLEIEAF